MISHIVWLLFLAVAVGGFACEFYKLITDGDLQ